MTALPTKLHKSKPWNDYLNVSGAKPVISSAQFFQYEPANIGVTHVLYLNPNQSQPGSSEFPEVVNGCPQKTHSLVVTNVGNSPSLQRDLHRTLLFFTDVRHVFGLEGRTLPKGNEGWCDPSQFTCLCPVTRAGVMKRVTQRGIETPLEFASPLVGLGTQRCRAIQNAKCKKASRGTPS